LLSRTLKAIFKKQIIEVGQKKSLPNTGYGVEFMIQISLKDHPAPKLEDYFLSPVVLEIFLEEE